MVKIAFSGKAFSGKTTSAMYFLNYYDHFARLSFATVLKEVVHKLFGVEEKDRELLQKTGMALRSVDEDVFTNYLIRLSERYNTGYKGITIDDLRFKNEADILRANGFQLVRLIVPPEILFERSDKMDKIMTPEQLVHPSETELDDYDFNYYITNADSMEHLHTMLDGIYKLIKDKQEDSKWT
jgi:hypothetical protein